MPLKIKKLVTSTLNKIYRLFNFNRFISVEDMISQKSFKMYLREDAFIERIIFSKGLYGEWEKESLKIWAELSMRSHFILDIGANTGIYSLIARTNNSSATIIAIEPIEINYQVLLKNVKKNRFQIQTEQVAISDYDGISKMYMLKDQLNYMTSVNEDRYALHPEIVGKSTVIETEVPVKPYSYIHEKYNMSNIQLVKIDVEGHELTVIRSMVPYLTCHKPTLLIEIIGEGNATELDKIFATIGYRYVAIDEVETSRVVDRLWDNDHHNFLICDQAVINFLKMKNLVA